MSTRFVNKMSRQPQYHNRQRPELLPDNVTAFPSPSDKTSARAQTNTARVNEPTAHFTDDGERTIDAIADHVVAARYLSAEEGDAELNRLIDLVLLQIGRRLAALDEREYRGPRTH